MIQNIKTLAVIFLVVSAIGFIDATYLTVTHYIGGIPPCTIRGCEIVLTSNQSRIAGIPVALVGSLYYATLLILSFAYLDSKKSSIIKFASYCTVVGILASIYFVYLQFFVIKAICQYCMISAGTSATLFVLGIYILSQTRSTTPANVSQ